MPIENQTLEPSDNNDNGKGLIVDNSDSVLRLVQITDTHLFGEPNKQLMGIDTGRSFLRVLELVRKRQQIDALLLSGDLSQDDSLAAYQFLDQSLAEFSCPKYWYKGNHDHAQHMQQVASQQGYLDTLIRTQHWQVVLLDSQVDGAVFGYLAEDQLDYLERCLAERPDLHTLISFHHQPIAMGSAWLDRIGLRNADEFLELIGRHHNVRAVLWGHVHQASDRVQNNVRFLSSPSTCLQFKPNSDDFAVDLQAPGYRWLNLQADGSIETEVVRVTAEQFLPDLTQNGY